LRLVSKRGCVVKNICKPACECLFNNKSSIRTANQPRDFFEFLFDSFAPTHLIRRFSQPAPPSELPYGSLSRLVPKSRFALRANLRLLLIRPSLRRLTLRAALAVSRAAAQPPGSAHLPRCLVVFIRAIRG
jgi:hypothetical protein